MFDRDSLYIWENYKFEILLKEAPENKITQYKITDPYLKNFVYRYENLIPWVKIKSVEDINKFISDNLIVNLTNKTKSGDDFDPDNTLYTTKINWDREINVLRIAAENNDQNAIMSLRLYNQDPESTKRKIISDINNSKRKIFNAWEKYILRDNEIYKKSPAFQFMMLSSAYKSTDNTKTAGLVPLNQAVVAAVYDQIKNIYAPRTEDNKKPINHSFNILDFYKQTNIAYAEKSLGSFSSGEGKWIKIPSKDHDSDNFEKNIELLMNLASGTNWCIAGESFARNYLSNGDFYIYFKNIDNNQRGVAAIRMDGDQIDEIRGTEQNQEMNDMYVQNVLDLVEEERLEGGKDFVKKLRAQKHLKYLKEKIQNGIPFTEEDREQMTVVMSIFTVPRIELKCIELNNQDKVVVMNTSYNKGNIASEPILTWLDGYHLDLEGIEDYAYILSDDYDPFENYDASRYDPAVNSVRYILNEIDDNHMNKIFDLALSQGWDISEEIIEKHDMIQLRGWLAHWITNNHDAEISELIIDGYGRGLIMGEYNSQKTAINNYLDRNFSEFIDKPTYMDWFESTYALVLKLSDAIKIYETYATNPDLYVNFYDTLKDYFNIRNYNDRTTSNCDDEYAANYIIENL